MYTLFSHIYIYIYMKVKFLKYKKIILFLFLVLGCVLLIPRQYTNEHFNNTFDNIYKNKS